VLCSPNKPMSAPPKSDATKSPTSQAGTSLLSPEQHRAIAARLRQADPAESGEESLNQLRLARLHDLVAAAIENRDKDEAPLA
jgi:hypothetical protein